MRLQRDRTRGFTLTEFAVAAGVIAIFVTTAFISMTQMNRYATAARLRTLALAVAQQRVDAILTTPWTITGTRPTILTAGTATENNLVIGDDATNAQAGLNSPFTSYDVTVTATRTTVVTNLTARTLRAVVTVSYNYRNRPYTIQLTTLRATDDI